MAFQFACDTCGKKIAVPHGTQGKQAQCPYCSSLMTIPLPESVIPANSPPSGAADVNSVAPFVAPLPTSNPGTSPQASSPQASLTPSPKLRGPTVGPVLRTSDTHPTGAGRLIVCAWFLCFYGILGLVVVGLQIWFFNSEMGEIAWREASNQMVVPPGIEKEQLLTLVSAAMKVLAGVGLAAGLGVLVGGIQMARQRTWGLALAGSICALFPFSPYFIVFGWPIAIWAIVVVVRNRNLFRRQARF